VEESMDMDLRPLRPQNYLFGCELKADKDDHFQVDNDENEHELSLRTFSLRAGAKDELHIAKAEAMNDKGSPIKGTLATLKMSVQPVSLSGFEITPPAVLRWQGEDVKLLRVSGKRCPGGGSSKFPQKKVKLAADEDDEDNDDDEGEKEEEEGEGKEEEEDFDEEEANPHEILQPKNAQKSNQNGKDSKPSTPRSKANKQEKTYKTPKGPSSVEDIKAKMQASIEKGGSLPKFINYVKNCFRMTDVEAIQDLWQWRKSL
uniref:Nucleophosmin n=1 Tax=Myotis lucifugus TaxID=59463 RepID=G1PYL5_MYOLU